MAAQPNINDDDDETTQTTDDDEDLTAAAKADQADASADTPASGNADSTESTDAGAAAPAAVPGWQEYLKQKYGLDKGVQDARADAQSDKRTAGVFQGLSTMFAGRQGTDDNFYNNLRGQADQRVAQAQQDRQQGIKDYLTQREVGRQDVADTRAAAENEFKQGQQNRTVLQQSDEDNPGSEQSKLAQDLAKQMGYKGDTSTLTATKWKSFGPQYEALFKAKEAAEARRLGFAQVGAYRQALEEDKRRKEAQVDLTALGKDLDAETASSRQGLGVAQRKVDSATNLMTFAGTSPAEIEAAKKDPKALAALQTKMNGLNPQQYAEVISGLMTQLSPNGGGSLGQFEKLKADTADQTKANILQYITNYPEAANAGPLITNNLLTLKNEQDNGQAIIDKHAAKMEAKHPLAFKHGETGPLAKSMVSTFSSGSGQPKRTVTTQELKDYADKHSSTPTAAAANLKANGYAVEGY